MTVAPADKSRGEELLVPLAAVVVAMIVGMALLALTGNNPVQAYGALVQGAIGGPVQLARTLINATPLVLTGLSVAFAFRAGLFNIGGTGQVIVGMLAAGAVGLHFEGLPQIIHVPLGLAAAVVAGASWGAIAGWLKAVRGAHEVITTIMLNYIAIRLAQYMLSLGSPLQDGSTNPRSEPMHPSAGFPILWAPDPVTFVHFGLVIAITMAALTWFVLNRTTLGYEIRAIGFNPDAAEYGGISVSRSFVIAMAVAGGFAGLAGASMILGDAPGFLEKTQFAGITVGFTGIAVALLGRNTVPGVIAAALLFGALDAGATEVQFSGGLEAGVATKLIQIIQGLIVFFVGADILFRKHVQRIMAGRGAVV